MAFHVMLRSCDSPLAAHYDVALLDLDGVVYVGGDAVANAPSALTRARELGMRLAFVTNNAARPPADVAQHLVELGISADASEVITSSQAAAHYLADRVRPGSAVLVVGATGLVEALRERGLRPVSSADDDPEAVVQGFSPAMDWRQLAEGAIAIRRGVPWVATNLDPTVPSPRGPLPGNGSLVAALRTATGANPIVTGKPQPTMHQETLERTNAKRPLVVGDRLDTDIEGADRVGCDSLLVLSGVTTPADLLAAPAGQRPTYLGPDLRSLLWQHPAPTFGSDGVRCGPWLVRHMVGELRLAIDPGAGDDRVEPDADRFDVDVADPEPGQVTDVEGAATAVGGGETSTVSIRHRDLDALRALCGAWWRAHESGTEHPSVRGEDETSARTLGRLGLA